MHPNYITKTWTFMGLVWGSPFTWLWFIGFFFVVIRRSPPTWLLFFLGATIAGLGLAAAVVWYNKHRLAAHGAAVARFAATHHYDYDPRNGMGYIESLGSLEHMHDARDLKARNIVVGPDWLYCDFSFSYYQRTKSGEYRASTIYYSVMSTTLPRKVPHILFDSIDERKRQFRFEFARAQKHSLEGDFDKYFVTYFPEGYTIDSLSIISPDVMLALRDAHAYDIEITENMVLLYGPLSNPAVQLPDMATKLAAIKKELLDNINTYRDQRLPGQQGRYEVTPQGEWLRRSKFWFIANLIASFGVVIAYFVYHIILLAVKK